MNTSIRQAVQSAGDRVRRRFRCNVFAESPSWRMRFNCIHWYVAYVRTYGAVVHGTLEAHGGRRHGVDSIVEPTDARWSQWRRNLSQISFISRRDTALSRSPAHSDVSKLKRHYTSTPLSDSSLLLHLISSLNGWVVVSPSSPKAILFLAR